MGAIEYQRIQAEAGSYFMETVRDFFSLPYMSEVRNYQFEISEVNGETYTILRVLTVSGDYHVFVQRHGTMIVDINSLSGHDIAIMRGLETV